MNIKNFKKFAKKPCNFHFTFLVKLVLDIFTLSLYNGQQGSFQCADWSAYVELFWAGFSYVLYLQEDIVHKN